MSATLPWHRRVARVAWTVLAIELLVLLGYSARLLAENPVPPGDATLSPDGTRFGRTRAERQRIFVELMRGELENRQRSERETDQHPWNRNRDDYFHQWEWGRILWVSHQQGLAEWQGWLLLEEGLREHWTPPPGVPIHADERPLARATPILAQRRVFTAAPPLPPPVIPVRTLPPLPPLAGPLLSPTVHPGPVRPPIGAPAALRP